MKTIKTDATWREAMTKDEARVWMAQNVGGVVEDAHGKRLRMSPCGIIQVWTRYEPDWKGSRESLLAYVSDTYQPYRIAPPMWTSPPEPEPEPETLPELSGEFKAAWRKHWGDDDLSFLSAQLVLAEALRLSAAQTREMLEQCEVMDTWPHKETLTNYKLRLKGEV